MYLLKQNYLKFNTKVSLSAFLLSFCALFASSSNAAEFSSQAVLDQAEPRNRKITQCEQILKTAEADFDRSAVAGRLAIISRPINLYRLNPEHYKKPHPLSLAICMGDVKLVEKFLTVVTDINSSDLDIRGWRQDYTMAHLTLHPFFPYFDVDIANRLSIIDLVANKSAHFNLIRSSGNYGWHPMYDDLVFANDLPNHEERKLLLTRALLYGGEPTAGQHDWADDSAHPLEFASERYDAYYSESYRDAMHMLTLLKDKSHVRLAAKTKERFKAEKARLDAALESLF